MIPLGKVRRGADIAHAEGILFATYATLRSPARQGKQSRLDQIVAWLAGGSDEDDRHAFSGVIVFDEAHAMANAAGAKGSRGEVKPSQQGRAGLRLQNALPDARVLYVSATGATTVPGLAYARRLGLWTSGETPFETRPAFIAAMEAGGVAAMEVLARDLKALGLYQARALAYDGVEVDILEHPLSPEQRRIYDAYAGAFKIIHANIQEALKATGIVDGDSTLNRNAKSAALSAFEGAKQRFFGHLLTSMKCPSLIRAIEADLDGGRAAVVQLVSTGEALMERRIAEIPASEWDDLSIDLTPREYVLDFLAHAFPVQLQEPFTDDDGNVMSRPVFDADRNPVLCQEAVAKRDALIQRLASLPPVQSALDQIVHRFGHDAVAEVMEGYVPTALLALTLPDALRLCDRLNARLGLDHDAWTKLVERSMAAGRDDAPLHWRCLSNASRLVRVGAGPSAERGQRPSEGIGTSPCSHIQYPAHDGCQHHLRGLHTPTERDRRRRDPRVNCSLGRTARSARSCSKTSLCCEAHRGTMRRGISARAAPAAHRRGAVSTAAVHVRARTRRKSA